MKIVHAADLHLDSPLIGLERYEGVPVHRIRDATRRAFENLIELCIDEKVELLLLAGDLWDGEWRDYSTGLFFAGQMSKLRQAGTRVVWIRGNHDAQSRIRRHLKFPENVRELSTRRAESVVFEQLGVAIHGQGFASREVTENLAHAYPKAKADLFNIGLLHTSVTGREGHASYAPCTLEDLIAKGYQYWALGHVHQREVLCRDPWVIFPGNLQGRHAREIGEKGATLIGVEDGRASSVEHRALDVVRFCSCRVDASDVANADDVLEAIAHELKNEMARAEGRMVAARVIVEGASTAHGELVRLGERFVEEVRALASDFGVEDLWIEKVKLQTRTPLDVGALAARDDALGEVLRGLTSLADDDEALLALGRELAEATKKLPAQLREGPDALAFDDPKVLRALLEDVERELLPRLIDPGDPP